MLGPGSSAPPAAEACQLDYQAMKQSMCQVRLVRTLSPQDRATSRLNGCASLVVVYDAANGQAMYHSAMLAMHTLRLQSGQ